MALSCTKFDRRFPNIAPSWCCTECLYLSCTNYTCFRHHQTKKWSVARSRIRSYTGHGTKTSLSAPLVDDSEFHMLTLLLLADYLLPCWRDTHRRSLLFDWRSLPQPSIAALWPSHYMKRDEVMLNSMLDTYHCYAGVWMSQHHTSNSVRYSWSRYQSQLFPRRTGGSNLDCRRILWTMNLIASLHSKKTSLFDVVRVWAKPLQIQQPLW